jgi:serine/threonine-protein phosphatase 2A regulatory subunit A
MDNDNDFLINVADGLLELKSFCNNNKEVSVLINPLKILASLDQPAVRDQAISCLKKLAEDSDKEFYQDYYFPLIEKLSAKGPLYSPRVVACCLIPITYPHVTIDKQEKLRLMFKQLALNENSPLVRRALAENI